jgi:hypothetical protein
LHANKLTGVTLVAALLLSFSAATKQNT